MKTRRSGPPSGAEQHRRWLELVDTDGPFLAVPPLKRVWPQGMSRMDADAYTTLVEAKPVFEKAWESWDRDRDDASALQEYREARDPWVETILREVIGWGDLLTLADPEDAEASEDQRSLTAISATSPNRSVTIHPSGMLRHQDTTAALVLLVDPCDSLRDVPDDGWAATPIDRMEALLRAANVPIGVVTDGRWWGLVCARPDAMVASGITDAQTWIEESDVRNAFTTLLQRRYLVGGKPEDRLPQLFAESVASAEEITEALGVQVRRAVELLVNAFSEEAVDARRHGDPDPLPEDRNEVYQAAVTVMMRVVFLLFAEERSLLPQGQLFTGGYGISGQLDTLDDRARQEGAEALDGTHLSWHRLLATTQALYAGATFEDIRLPAYGGSVFDPNRFAFLTARDDRGTLRMAVSDRVMLEVFRAVQVAQLRGQPARRISFRDVDVEQIGYIYEGLLGYTCTDVTDVTVGLKGSPGTEPEIGLIELEKLAENTGAGQQPVDQNQAKKFAEAVIDSVKQSQPAAKPPTKAALAKALTAEVEDGERAMLAVTRDEQLQDRLRPFIGIIRRDLRDRPMIIQPGGLLVTETPSRETSGAHYTPRSLAEEIVLHALEPLVYRPGPHQTADQSAWKLISSDDILELKIADIACGSGAFLVAAGRYLAARLVEAWRAEGATRASGREQQIHALRQVVANCLYGADINPMAVEMCKLSLWLVSLDPRLPFSFVDDKILTGNSLLGLTDEKQLRALHIDPDQAPAQPRLFDLDVDAILRKAARQRERLANEIDNTDPQRNATTKHRQWRQYQEDVAPLRKIADGVIAAGLELGGKPGRQLGAAYENLRLAVSDAFPLDGEEAKPEALDTIIDRGLTPTVETDYHRWQPLHWILAVPDVMEHGGFDAVIGNPPFLGGSKISGAMGSNIRDWLPNVLADGQSGNPDLVAYFFLRAVELINGAGAFGLIATNTVAQGGTREVSLDRIVDSGVAISRAIQSQPWPVASANLEFAAVWGAREPLAAQAERVCNGDVVREISTLLEPAGMVEGIPLRLVENRNIAFEGCKPYGRGFVVDPDEAQLWIREDPRNAEVLFPYLTGEDVSTRPHASPSRWVIDFYTRSECEAATYFLPFARVQSQVKPERQKSNRKVRRERWWQHGERAPGLRRAIAELYEVLVMTRVSKTVAPIRVSTGRVFSDSTDVFATNEFATQAVLSSNMHQTWAITRASSLETRVRYTPSDVFETFPRPYGGERLAEFGKTLDTERREIMLRRDLGLTKLYNLINDPDIADESDADVARMRQIHADLDHAVMAAYGWEDLPLDHGFHTYRQMTRWTVSPAARVEILDRLMEENHRRAALEVHHSTTDIDPPD
jgi:hypothetical protein